MNATVMLLNDSGRWLVAQLGRMSVELAILAGIVLIALYVLRVKSPALRHLFWGLLLAKPVVTFLVASPLSLYGFLWPPIPEVFYVPGPVPAQMEQLPYEHSASIPDASPSTVQTQRPETPPFWRQIDRYGLLSAIWALTAGAFGLRLLLGCAYVAFLRSTALTQREGHLAELLAEASRPFRMWRRVKIATTRVTHGPVLAGIFRPIILMPESMAEALAPKQLKLIITHELAHAKRWDNLVLLVQRLAETFFFFHPVVWFCGWMMRREAEAACDDIVVLAYGEADGASAAAYADSLTRVAEMKCGVTRRLLLNTFAAAESNFARRIHRILSGRGTRMTLWLSLATGGALILIGVLGLPTAASSASPPERLNEGPGTSVPKLPVSPSFVAALPGGRSVELVAVGSRQANDATFWRPDGTPLAEPPYEHLRDEMNGGNVAAQGKAYELVFRRKGIDDSLLKRSHYEGALCSGETPALAKDKCVVPGLTVAAVVLDAKATTEDVRLGFASGDWKAILTHNPRGSRVAGFSGDGYFVAFAEPYEKENSVNVTLTLNGRIVENAVRLVAVDRSGRSHTTGAASAINDKVQQDTYGFEGMKMDDLQEFRLEPESSK